MTGVPSLFFWTWMFVFFTFNSIILGVARRPRWPAAYPRSPYPLIATHSFLRSAKPQFSIPLKRPSGESNLISLCSFESFCPLFSVLNAAQHAFSSFVRFSPCSPTWVGSERSVVHSGGNSPGAPQHVHFILRPYALFPSQYFFLFRSPSLFLAFSLLTHLRAHTDCRSFGQVFPLFCWFCPVSFFITFGSFPQTCLGFEPRAAPSQKFYRDALPGFFCFKIFAPFPPGLTPFEYFLADSAGAFLSGSPEIP